jgi:hypothetical protein
LSRSDFFSFLPFFLSFLQEDLFLTLLSFLLSFLLSCSSFFLQTLSSPSCRSLHCCVV